MHYYKKFEMLPLIYENTFLIQVNKMLLYRGEEGRVP